MTPEPSPLWPDPATILERSRGVFFAQWEELLRLRRTVMKTTALDAVHDLRVASRRFRAALELFFPLAAKRAGTELKKNVRKLTRRLGGLRNMDEAISFFQSHRGTDTVVGTALYSSLSELRSRELKRIKKALKAFDHRELDRLVRKLVNGLNEESITERTSISLPAYFSDVSIRLYLQIQQLQAVAAQTEQRDSRHTLRIAIKKWRYFFEIISHILDRDYATLLEQLKEYQSLLGQMNDVSVFEELVSGLSLPRDEREQAQAILRAEDDRLFDEFSELIERKPLAYTVLI